MASERVLRVASIWAIDKIGLHELREEISVICPDAQVSYSPDDDILIIRGCDDSEKESAVVACITALLQNDKHESSSENAQICSIAHAGVGCALDESQKSRRDEKEPLDKKQEIQAQTATETVNLSRRWVPSHVQVASIRNNSYHLLSIVAGATGTTISVNDDDPQDPAINVSAETVEMLEEALRRLGNFEKLMAVLQTPFHAHICYCPSTNGLRFGIVEYGQLSKGPLERILLDPVSPVKKLIGNLIVPVSCRIDASTNTFQISSPLRDAVGLQHSFRLGDCQTLKCLSGFKFPALDHPSRERESSSIAASIQPGRHITALARTVKLPVAGSMKSSQVSAASEKYSSALSTVKVPGMKVRRPALPGTTPLKRTQATSTIAPHLATPEESGTLITVKDANDDKGSAEPAAALSPTGSRSTTGRSGQHGHSLLTTHLGDCESQNSKNSSGNVDLGQARHLLGDFMPDSPGRTTRSYTGSFQSVNYQADSNNLPSRSLGSINVNDSKSFQEATILMTGHSYSHQQAQNVCPKVTGHSSQGPSVLLSSSRSELLSDTTNGTRESSCPPSTGSQAHPLAQSPKFTRPGKEYPNDFHKDSQSICRPSLIFPDLHNQTSGSQAVLLRTENTSDPASGNFAPSPRSAQETIRSSDQAQGRRWNSQSVSLPLYYETSMNGGYPSFCQDDNYQTAAPSKDAYNFPASVGLAHPGHGPISHIPHPMQPSYGGFVPDSGHSMYWTPHQRSFGLSAHYSEASMPPVSIWTCPCGRSVPVSYFPWHSRWAANGVNQASAAHYWPPSQNTTSSPRTAQPPMDLAYRQELGLVQGAAIPPCAYLGRPERGSSLSAQPISAKFENQNPPANPPTRHHGAEPMVHERVASLGGAGREFHSVMRQRTPNPPVKEKADSTAGATEKLSKKRWRPLDISYNTTRPGGLTSEKSRLPKGVTPLREDPNLTSKVWQTLAPLMATAQVFPGPLRLEIRLGTVAILRTSGVTEEVFMTYEEMNEIIHPPGYIHGSSTLFFERLTTSPADIDHTLDFTAEGARLLESEPCLLGVSYEFHCFFRYGDTHVIEVDETGRSAIQQPQFKLGSVDISYPDRIWDAAAGLYGFIGISRPPHSAAIHIMETITKAIWVEPNRSLIRLRVQIDKSSFGIKKVLLKRKSHHRCVAGLSAENAASALYLQVIEVQDLVITPDEENPNIIEATCKPLDEMVKLHRQWWEMSIASSATNHVLSDRSSCRAGEVNTSWKPVDILGTQTKIDTDSPPSATAKSIGRFGLGPLLGLATTILENIDVVGFFNCS